MAAAPHEDARRTLAELEAKLVDLERELLAGRAGAPGGALELAGFEAAALPPVPDEQPALFEDAREAEPEPEAKAEPEPEPEREPEPEAKAEPEPEPEREREAEPEREREAEPEPGATQAPPEARSLVAALRATVEALAATADRVRAEARAAGEEHARMLGRLQRAAQAAGRAEAAAAEAGRLSGSVVVEAGPLADPGVVLALRDALAAQPGARDAYVRAVEDGRAVIEVHLDPAPE
jgi:outer membrane biosynthesis protein TonB